MRSYFECDMIGWHEATGSQRGSFASTPRTSFDYFVRVNEIYLNVEYRHYTQEQILAVFKGMTDDKKAAVRYLALLVLLMTM